MTKLQMRGDFRPDRRMVCGEYKGQLWQRVNSKPVNERQRQVIQRMLDDWKGYLNTSKYANLAKCSTDTALPDIRELLKRGILVKNEGRAAEAELSIG